MALEHRFNASVLVEVVCVIHAVWLCPKARPGLANFCVVRLFRGLAFSLAALVSLRRNFRISAYYRDLCCAKIQMLCLRCRSFRVLRPAGSLIVLIFA